jgi:hypothetical protein
MAVDLEQLKSLVSAQPDWKAVAAEVEQCAADMDGGNRIRAAAVFHARRQLATCPAYSPLWPTKGGYPSFDIVLDPLEGYRILWRKDGNLMTSVDILGTVEDTPIAVKVKLQRKDPKYAASGNSPQKDGLSKSKRPAQSGLRGRFHRATFPASGQ